MKIATYNVWNETKGIGNRFEQLVHEISAVSADIIGLQEVTTIQGGGATGRHTRPL